MVKKKKEEKEEKISQTIKKSVRKGKLEIEKFSISELLKKNEIKPLNAVGFINYYGLNEDFRREFETGESENKFSNAEFEDMYKRYIEREI